MSSWLKVTAKQNRGRCMARYVYWRRAVWHIYDRQEVCRGITRRGGWIKSYRRENVL